MARSGFAWLTIDAEHSLVSIETTTHMLHCGSAEEARLRIEEGWQFIAIGSELKMMLTSAADIVQKLGLGAKGEMAKY